jgi:PqqD family protein of HPr-rel-A system
MDPLRRLADLAVSESGFVFDPYSGATYSLNATGRAVLDALRRGADAAAVEADLRARFSVEDGADVARDVRDFLHAVRAQGWAAPGGDR